MYKLYLLFAHYTRGADGTVCGGSISVINFLLRAKKWKILKANSFSWKLAHCMHVFMQICIKKTKGRLILMIELLKKVHNKVELETR